jgi:hypothetical protein
MACCYCDLRDSAVKIDIVVGMLIALVMIGTLHSSKEDPLSTPVKPSVLPEDGLAAKTSVTVPVDDGQARNAAVERADRTGPNDPIGAQLWTGRQAQVDLPMRHVDRGFTSSRPVRINPAEFKELQAGDRIELNIPQLSTPYAAFIDDVIEHGNGDMSWRGHLAGYEDPYAVVFTMGNSAHFATITTPEGAYLLEATDSSGWMVALVDLENLIDTNLQDYRIPDIRR